MNSWSPTSDVGFLGAHDQVTSTVWTASEHATVSYAKQHRLGRKIAHANRHLQVRERILAGLSLLERHKLRIIGVYSFGQTPAQMQPKNCHRRVLKHLRGRRLLTDAEHLQVVHQRQALRHKVLKSSCACDKT